MHDKFLDKSATPPTFHITCLTGKYFFKLIEEWPKQRMKSYVWKDFKKKYQNNGISEIKEEKVKADKMKETDFITFPGLYGYTVLDFSDIKK